MQMQYKYKYKYKYINTKLWKKNKKCKSSTAPR